MNRRKLAAEALGSAFLLAIVVGSGIMGEQLADGNAAIALLANSIATGAGLFVLIALFGTISNAHFNPAVSFAAMIEGDMKGYEFLSHGFVQIAGALAGVWAAHAMFGLDILQTSSKVRSGPSQWLAEGIATFGLLLTIFGSARSEEASLVRTAAMVALYITSAYWFTASTSFANPAVTLARSLTDTFAGIRPSNIAGFILAQFAGATLAAWVARVLFPKRLASSG